LRIPQLDDLSEVLIKLLACPNIASKEAVIRRYDHEVQGGTVVKPLTGVTNDGPSDATVARPLDPQLARDDATYRGLAIGCGINPRYGTIDPYAMAWAAVDEALRNVVAVGADPDGVALLDNFCWGNPNLSDRLGGLVRAAQGCHDAALNYGTPFVSGKDSLNNEYVDANGDKTPIPPTLLISALGFVPDVRCAVTMDLKSPGDRIYVVGETRGELGGSALYGLWDELGESVPAPVPESMDAMRVLHRAMRKGLVRACHDCSEGGLAVAAAEMAFAGVLGLTLRLADLPRADDADHDAIALFSETSGRFLVEVAEADAAAFEAAVDGTVWAWVGETGGDALRVTGVEGLPVIEVGIGRLKAAWQGGGLVDR
jgi:phosphoribosylformylglycinamidine synthase